MPIFMKYDGIDGSVTSSESFHFKEAPESDPPVQSLSLNFTKITYQYLPMSPGHGAEGSDSADVYDGFADGTSNTLES